MHKKKQWKALLRKHRQALDRLQKEVRNRKKSGSILLIADMLASMRFIYKDLKYK